MFLFFIGTTDEYFIKADHEGHQMILGRKRVTHLHEL